ncbi:hypothetical protein Q31b_56500 [Novipirellula aureliae]|uniref:Uncharacterized protein n=1 Tax=Novipirellula aureliae TaxID=2527966 RepID=A0A5C6DGS1_9BACT|nr:hypothetical protein [Novipirellula aureliae]TWU34179.1 hypothetical protein Q31b_56500 [Novipirellula aureliae]
MTGPNYCTLALNRKTLGLLFLGGIVLSAGLGIWQSGAWPRHVLYSTPLFFIHCCFVGSLFGSLSAVCWIATAINRQWIRYSIQGGAALLLSAVLSALISYESWPFSLANCAGFILSHNLLFGWMNIPFFNEADRTVCQTKRQFSIGGILIFTTTAALLMVFARWFDEPTRADQYWFVLIGLWFFMPLTGGVVAKAVLNKHFHSSLGWFGLAILMIVIGPIGLDYAECSFSQMLNGDGSLAIKDKKHFDYILFYLAIFLSYATSIGLTALAGAMGCAQQDQAPT